MVIRTSDYLCDKDKKTGSKSLIVENPSNVEDLTFFFTDIPLEITKIRPILVGSSTPSVTWTLRHGTDRSTVGSEVIATGTVTTEVTTGIDITTFDIPNIIANSHIWLETTDKSGVVISLALTIFYEED